MKGDRALLLAGEHMDGAIIGYTIIGLSVLLGGGTMFNAWRSWDKKKPTDYHRGVGMRYLPGAEQPWAHWREAIDACLDVIQKHPQFSKDFARLADVWIEVVPYDQPILNPTIRTGWLDGDKAVPRPLTEADAENRARVTGSVKTEQLFPWSKRQYIIQLLQLREGDSYIDLRLARGTGAIKPMNSSAIFYEFAKRHVEFVLTGSYYALGSVEPIYAELEGRMNDEYNMRNP